MIDTIADGINEHVNGLLIRYFFIAISITIFIAIGPVTSVIIFLENTPSTHQISYES